MKLRERAEDIFDWGMAERRKKSGDDMLLSWEGHSRGAAKVAETIATHCGMDADKAYAMGLLHDIGRYKGLKIGMYHITYGYDILKEKGMPEEIAKICLTHSFNPQDRVDNFILEDDEETTEFVKNYVKSATYDDYDLLIQLADYMSGTYGVTTIEWRFCSIIQRHGFHDPRAILNTIYKIKKYFNEKVGMDIYELFHDEIAESMFHGIPAESECSKRDYPKIYDIESNDIITKEELKRKGAR